MKAMIFLPVCLFLAAGPTRSYQVRDWEFRWTLWRQDRVAVAIEKEPDRTTVVLTSEFGLLRMTPAAAASLTPVLAEAHQIADRMKSATEDVRQTTKVGEVSVTWWQSPKYGFSASVHNDSQTIMVTRDQAVAIADQLKDIKGKVAYIDKRIAP